MLITLHPESRSLKVARRAGDAKQPFLALVNQQQQAAETTAKELEKEKEVSVPAPEGVTLRRLKVSEVWDLRRDVVDKKTREIVEEILNDVREKGEEALIRQSVRLGDLKSKDQSYIISKEEMHAAFQSLTPDQQDLLQRTTERIRAFAKIQKNAIKEAQSTLIADLFSCRRETH